MNNDEFDSNDWNQDESEKILEKKQTTRAIAFFDMTKLINDAKTPSDINKNILILADWIRAIGTKQFSVNIEELTVSYLLIFVLV